MLAVNDRARIRREEKQDAFVHIINLWQGFTLFIIADVISYIIAAPRGCVGFTLPFLRI